MTKINPKRIVVPDDFHPDWLPDAHRVGKHPVEPETNPAFRKLMEMVKNVGVLVPIPVRTDAGRIVLAHPGAYYRLMAAKEAGLTGVPTVGLEDALISESVN